MLKEKSLRIELSRENPVGNGYLYSTLELPAEEYEIRDALQRAHLGNETDVYHEITILDSPYVYDLQDMRLDSPTIDELNFLSKRLAAMDETERLIYAAVLPKVIGDDDIVSMKTLINCTYGLDEVMINCHDRQSAFIGYRCRCDVRCTWRCDLAVPHLQSERNQIQDSR